MGDVANDMVGGACCSACGIYFKDEHGYPVLCVGCWDDTPANERGEGLQRAIIKELGDD